jgi:hypothetical protein
MRDTPFGATRGVSLAGEELDALRVVEYWTLSASYLWQIKDIFALRGPQ